MLTFNALNGGSEYCCNCIQNSKNMKKSAYSVTHSPKGILDEMVFVPNKKRQYVLYRHLFLVIPSWDGAICLYAFYAHFIYH